MFDTNVFSISGQEDSQSTVSDERVGFKLFIDLLITFKAINASRNPLDDLFGPQSLPSHGFVKPPNLTAEVDAEG